MDSDFWVSRLALAAAKRQFFCHHNHHHNAHLDRLIVDEIDGEDDVEFKMIPLCCHLEHDHYDETDETVCTICADSIDGNMLRHITTEHEQLHKMAIQRSKSSITANPINHELSLLSRDLQETHLNALLADKGQQSSRSATDPLPAKNIWQSSSDPSLSSEEREKRIRQAAGKAAFVQDLLCSTMFSD